MAVRMVNAIARTIPSFGAMCPLLVSRLSDFYTGIIGGMCELLHTPALVQKMHGGQTPYGIGDYLGPGQSVLSFIANRSSFLIGELLLGKLSETVVVQGNTPHDRPGFLMCHLIGNRASFLCTKAPMLRIPETNFLQGITSVIGEIFRRSSYAAAAGAASLSQSSLV
jgi:hypothetical protein